MWLRATGNWQTNKRAAPPGFTLMEIVVAMVIFTLATVVIAEIFVNVQRAQQRVKDTQLATTELRYLMDVLAREVRSDTLDYTVLGSGCTDPTGTLAASSNTLRLCSGENKSVVFGHDPTGATCETADTDYTGGCVFIIRELGTPRAISSPQLSIDSLTFYPTPLKNPFPTGGAGATTPDVQPSVTIVVKSSSLNLRAQERKPLYLQTTVTARTYAR